MADQLLRVLVVALPVACVTWTLTHEEVLREPQDWLKDRSRAARSWWRRKFFFMWTCEYCLSHYVAGIFVALADLQLLLPDWRGYLLAWLSIVAMANVYMSAYSRLRVDITRERAAAREAETRLRRTSA